MRRLLLALLALSGPAAAAVSPARRTRAECGDSFSMEGVLADAAAGRFKGNESKISEAVAPYFEYEAFLRKDPRVCDALKVFRLKHLTYRDEEHSGDLRCRMHYWEISFAHAFITRDPGTRSICVERFRNEGQVSLARIKEACGIILERRDDPDALCDATAPLLQPRRDEAAIGRCKAYHRAYNGDASACAKLPPNQAKRERCEAYAAFARANREGKPELCGESSLCRALVSGVDDARAQLRQQAKDGVCSLGAGEAAAPGESSASTAGLEAVDAALGRAAGALRSAGKTRAECAASFSMNGLVDDVSAGRFGGLETESHVYQSAAPYYEQLALSRKDPAACEPLKAFDVLYKTHGEKLHSGDLRCRVHYWESAFVRAFVALSPGFMETCLGKYRNEGQVGDEAAAKACGIMRDEHEHPERIAAAVGPILVRPDDAETLGKIRALFPALGGDRAACIALSTGSFKSEKCLEYAAFHDAYRAGDPELCGSSRLCRTLMGLPESAVQRYADDARTSVCGLFPERRDAAESKALLLEARTALDEAARGLGTDSGDEVRRTRLAALRRDYDEASRGAR